MEGSPQNNCTITMGIMCRGGVVSVRMCPQEARLNLLRLSCVGFKSRWSPIWQPSQKLTVCCNGALYIFSPPSDLSHHSEQTLIASMCNVPSGAEAYAKLYESVSSDGVSLTLHRDW